VALETLGEMSVPRNNLVTDLVLRTGLIEKLGTGIQRMRLE
jgi:predicted HTH transcriptional regulator